MKLIFFFIRLLSLLTIALAQQVLACDSPKTAEEHIRTYNIVMDYQGCLFDTVTLGEDGRTMNVQFVEENAHCGCSGDEYSIKVDGDEKKILEAKIVNPGLIEAKVEYNLGPDSDPALMEVGISIFKPKRFEDFFII